VPIHKRSTDAIRGHKTKSSNENAFQLSHDLATLAATFVAGQRRPNRGSTGRAFPLHGFDFVGSNPIGGSLVVRPGSDRSVFRFDSGIRLRRTKKLAIVAAPNHKRSTDGIRAHKI
jgi:hypothetical protein